MDGEPAPGLFIISPAGSPRPVVSGRSVRLSAAGRYPERRSDDGQSILEVTVEAEILPLTCSYVSPLTESNRRPSPYHEQPRRSVAPGHAVRTGITRTRTSTDEPRNDFRERRLPLNLPLHSILLGDRTGDPHRLAFRRTVVTPSIVSGLAAPYFRAPGWCRTGRQVARHVVVSVASRPGPQGAAATKERKRRGRTGPFCINAVGKYGEGLSMSSRT
jgi:hypothetical protein